MNTPARSLVCLSAIFSLGSVALCAEEEQRQDKTSEAKIHMAQGREALQYGDLKAAKKAFRQALRLDRKLPWANFALGLVYHQERDFKNAAKYYRMETKSFPVTGEAYLNWGACAATMNQLPRAVLAFDGAVSRLGPDEEYVNNLGKAIHALLENPKDLPDDPLERRKALDERKKKLSFDLRRAIETYRELEAHLNAKLAEVGMTRWGATKIPLERMRDIEERIMRLEQMVQDQVLQLQEFTFEANTVRHNISQVKMSLRDYRRVRSRRGALEAELSRLEVRLRDLQDNIRLARANVRRLEEQKPKPPWNSEYAIFRRVPAER